MARKSLPERIAELREELDQFITERAEAEAKRCPGVPVLVIRQMLMARGACACHVAQLLDREEVA